MLEQQTAASEMPLLTVTAADLRAYASSSSKFIGRGKKSGVAIACDGARVPNAECSAFRRNGVSNHNFKARAAMPAHRRRCFPAMLHALLCEGSEALHWSPCGSVVILTETPSLFDVLSPHMRTRNIQSVRRQLNNYAFVKLESGRAQPPHESHYFRPGFCKDDPDAAAEMQRPSKRADRDVAEDVVKLRRMLQQREARIRKLKARVAELVARVVDQEATVRAAAAGAEAAAPTANTTADAFDIALDYYDDAEDGQAAQALPEWNPQAWDAAY